MKPISTRHFFSWLHAEGEHAGAPYRYASAAYTSDWPRPIRRGRALRCDATNPTAELEDPCRNEEPATTYQDPQNVSVSADLRSAERTSRQHKAPFDDRDPQALEKGPEVQRRKSWDFLDSHAIMSQTSFKGSPSILSPRLPERI